jgi:hypothetical protein
LSDRAGVGLPGLRVSPSFQFERTTEYGRKEGDGSLVFLTERTRRDANSMSRLHTAIFFLKPKQKFCPNLLIKKKRIAQLIYGKPGKNQYKQTTTNHSEIKRPHALEQTT